MEWIEKGVEEVCLLPKPKDVLFPEYRTNENLHLLCNKLGGHITVTDSQLKQDHLVDEFRRLLGGYGYLPGRLFLIAINLIKFTKCGQQQCFGLVIMTTMMRDLLPMS